MSSLNLLFSYVLCFFYCMQIPIANCAPLPNIIYILADDIGYGDLSIYHLQKNNKIQTPHIDQLARQGMLFTNAHTTSSVCTPSRYSILTGRYPWRNPKATRVISGYDKIIIEKNTPTVATMLNSNSYETAIIGKWHLGLNWAERDFHQDLQQSLQQSLQKDTQVNFAKGALIGPNNFGLDYSYIIPASLDMPPYCYLENQKVVELPTVYTDGNKEQKNHGGPYWGSGLKAASYDFYQVLPHFTQKAIEYIKNHRHFSNSNSNSNSNSKSNYKSKTDTKSHLNPSSSRPFFLYFALPEGNLLLSSLHPIRRSHPVVHVTYQDAVTYCQWAGKRLPTEAEFEYAARGGLKENNYSWGNDFKINGKWMANIWQGNFPEKNSHEDGYSETSPVKSFPPNGYGLYDMAGNVWQWTSDWYRPDTYQSPRSKVTINPQGPKNSFDPSETNVPKKVQRGGSYLCNSKYCSRYLVYARGKGAIDSSAQNLGFRCAFSPLSNP